VKEMRDISQTLARLFYKAVWVPTTVSSTGFRPRSPYLSLLDGNQATADACGRTLMQLRVCDERRSFADSPSFWLVGRAEIASESFIQRAVRVGQEPARLRGDERQSMTPSQLCAADLLRLTPFMIPFNARAQIFSQWVAQERDDNNLFNALGAMRGHWVTIRRAYIFEDAYTRLNGLGAALKEPVRIKFIDEHGIEEAGIDGGGVFKEFMHEFMTKAFSPLYGLFKETTLGKVYPDPASRLASTNHLDLFEFLGRMLGKILVDGITVKLPFASFFLNKILGRVNFVDDLRSLDLEVHRNMKFLKNCDPAMVADLGLNFVVVDHDYGETVETELIRGGKDVAVTGRNRMEYALRVANYRLNRQIKAECDAFLKGLGEVINLEWLRIFNEQELQELISGKEGAIDVVDLQQHTHYSGGYSVESATVKWLWQAVAGFTPEQQSKLLRFVTSSPRAPLLGFRFLNPSFCVHRADSDGGTRLPSASTCMNLLKLPEYGDFETTKSKLLMAIEASTGFGLS